MIIHNCKQRSDEWRELRRCRLTASRFGDLMARKSSAKYQNYLLDKVFDLENVADYIDSGPWFEVGIKNEIHAIGRYSWRYNIDVQRIGFAVHDDLSFVGCSPDGLTVNGGVVEVKCRHYRDTFYRAVQLGPKAHWPQIQGLLWITERPWLDYLNYWWDEKLDLEKFDVQRVRPDLPYITKIKHRCVEAWREIEHQLKLRREPVWPGTT